MNNIKDYNLSGQLIGLAMKVHSALGPGFLESIYENALKIELQGAGMPFEAQKGLTVFYHGEIVGEFQCDLLVANALLVELKASHSLSPAHEVQLVNYLAATGISEGLLINFGARSLECKKKFKDFKPKIKPRTELTAKRSGNF